MPIAITVPTAGAQLSPGQQTVTAEVTGVDYNDILFVRVLIKRTGELPANPNFIPDDSNVSFLNCNNPMATPLVFSGNWIPCPTPPMGQTWNIEIRVWLVIRAVGGNNTIACTVRTPMPGM